MVAFLPLQTKKSLWFVALIFVVCSAALVLTTALNFSSLRSATIDLRDGKVFRASKKCQDSGVFDGPELLRDAIYEHTWMAKSEAVWLLFGIAMKFEKLPIATRSLEYIYPLERWNSELGLFRTVIFAITKKQCAMREFYLQEVYFGRKSYGLTQAAKTYFGKQAEKLRIDEVVVLVLYIVHPNHYHDKSRANALLRKRNTLIDALTRAGKMSRQNATAAKARSIKILTTNLN